MRSILIVSDKSEVIQQIQSAFTNEHRFGKASDKTKAFEILQRERYDLIFIDINLLLDSTQAGGDHEVLSEFKKYYPTIEIVILVARDMIRQAVKFVKAGASDYLTYPIATDEVQLVTESINRAILQKSEIDYLRDKFWRADSFTAVQTKNAAMQLVFNKIRSVAPTKSTTLLVGETGTGKGVLASLIHRHSNRDQSQFISVHCGAIPDTLLESELFGHEKGAFTGAIRRKLGKFEISKGGTIFLDEVGTITPSAQIKLLQVLQDGTFSRVGGEETLTTDARIIAATNADLKSLVEDGSFRADLFYMLNVIPLHVPSLLERPSYIRLLADKFLEDYSAATGEGEKRFTEEATAVLVSYGWPGNVRELENVVERLCVMTKGAEITVDDLPEF